MHMHWRVHQFFIFRLIKYFRRYDSTWFWNLYALLHWSAVFTPGLVILIRVIMFVQFQPIEVNSQFLSRSIYISYSVHNSIQCLHNDVWAFPGAMELCRSTSWYGWAIKPYIVSNGKRRTSHASIINIFLSPRLHSQVMPCTVVRSFQINSSIVVHICYDTLHQQVILPPSQMLT